MILPDLNLLIYAHAAGSPHHAAARAWWARTMNGDRPVGLPWALLTGFIRLTTHRRVLEPPLEASAAIALVESWLAHPLTRVLTPGPRHQSLLAECLDAAGVAGALTTDAHLAALAIEHGAEVHTNDRDFDRFPRVRRHNPLT